MSFYYGFLGLLFIPLLLLWFSNAKRDTTQKLLYLATAFAIIALMRPVIANKPTQEYFDAKEYIIAIDASYSMQAGDIAPSRFEAAKNSVRELLQNNTHDRFTLFIFTSNPLLISPPTTDTQISLMALDAIDPQHILSKSTSLKKLFSMLAEHTFEQKNLLLYTDGGEEHDLQALTQICKTNAITPYIIATASKKGALLQKGDKSLLDENGDIVISRINPILKPLAKECGGAYFEITKTNLAKQLTQSIQHKEKTKLSATLYSYKELFYYPLFLSIILFTLAVTKLQKLLPFVVLITLFSDKPIHADQLLDFVYISKATKSYNDANYKEALRYFEKTTPSVESRYNMALALYKLAQYKKAAQTLAAIKTAKPHLKQKILYTLGLCATRLKKYDKAKIYYKKVLSLGEDKEAYENLLQLYRYDLMEKKELQTTLKKTKTNQKSGAGSKKKSTKASKKSSTAASSPQKSGAGVKKTKQKKQKAKKTGSTKNEQKYKFSYKAYELINKGYTDEIHPW